MYEQVWNEGVQQKPKLRTYKQFKNKIEVEPYLRANVPRWKRAILARLRTGSLGLQVELGRYSNQSLKDRLCQYCDNCVEDELHFLFNCHHYKLERDKLNEEIIELSKCNSDIERFKVLNDMPFTFCNYVAKIWDKRCSQVGA